MPRRETRFSIERALAEKRRKRLTARPKHAGRVEIEKRLAELAAGKEVTAGERAWLDAHVQADGAVDEYEQALIEFLAGGEL